MKKIIQLTTIILLGTSLIAHADVQFSLINKSSQPIWVCVYANGDPATGQFSYDCEKQINPNASLSQQIANGEMEITISIVNPSARNGFDRFRTYKTISSADNKNKILIWNNTEYPQTPLFPEVEKQFMGLMKSKKPNNIDKAELYLSKNKNL
jgi:hypothetical protein